MVELAEPEEPGWPGQVVPVHAAAHDQLVGRGDGAWDLAQDEEPHDGQGDVGELALAAAQAGSQGGGGGRLLLLLPPLLARTEEAAAAAEAL